MCFFWPLRAPPSCSCGGLWHFGPPGPFRGTLVPLVAFNKREVPCSFGPSPFYVLVHMNTPKIFTLTCGYVSMYLLPCYWGQAMLLCKGFALHRILKWIISRSVAN